jgi:hypothetical protein
MWDAASAVNLCRWPLTAVPLTAGLQQVENYEYEMPSDFEDEEIDEEMAFTGLQPAS